MWALTVKVGWRLIAFDDGLRRTKFYDFTNKKT